MASDLNEGSDIVAATARVHGLTVVTRNAKDFELAGVQVLDPFASSAG